MSEEKHRFEVNIDKAAHALLLKDAKLMKRSFKGHCIFILEQYAASLKNKNFSQLEIPS